MTFTLLKIRYLQIIRALKEGGLGSLLLPVFIVGLSFASFKVFHDLRNASIFTIFLFVTCVYMQLKRTDKIFAQLHITNFRFQMYVEYVLLTLPFSFTALFTPHFYFFPILLLLLLVVPYINFNTVQKTLFKNISYIFPSHDSIEWISGIRSSYLSIFTLYILAVATCWLRFFPLLLLWFITTSILNFYNENEDLSILKSYEHRARNFLQHKIKKHCLYIFYFYAPILTLNALFNTDFIDINITFIMVQFALITFAITNKYASYVPAQKNIGSNIMVAIVSIGSIMPYLLPLPIVFAIVYYYKAIQNLKNYFHD
jgi:hypothetical protein